MHVAEVHLLEPFLSLYLITWGVCVFTQPFHPSFFWLHHLFSFLSYAVEPTATTHTYPWQKQPARNEQQREAISPKCTQSDGGNAWQHGVHAAGHHDPVTNGVEATVDDLNSICDTIWHACLPCLAKDHDYRQCNRCTDGSDPPHMHACQGRCNKLPWSWNVVNLLGRPRCPVTLRRIGNDTPLVPLTTHARRPLLCVVNL